jgi:hypothetical protein
MFSVGQRTAWLRWFCGVFLGLGLWGGTLEVEARNILEDGTRPMEFTFGLGPAINVQNFATQFKMTQTFGYHFMGNSSGPALGLSTQEAFGNGWFTFEVGPQFWWDIQPAQRVGFYITPFVQLGYALLSYSDPRVQLGTSYAYHSFNINFGARAKFILADRWILFFQPFAINIYIGENTYHAWFNSQTFVAVRFDLQFAGGVTF